MLIKFIFVFVTFFLCSAKANSSSGSLEFYITLNECPHVNTTNVLGECSVVEGCGFYRSVKSEIEFTNNYQARFYSNNKCSGVFTRKTIWFECVEGGSEGSDYLVFCNDYPGSNVTIKSDVATTTTTSTSTFKPIFSSGSGSGSESESMTLTTTTTGQQTTYSITTSSTSGISGSSVTASSSSSTFKPIFSSGGGNDDDGESIKSMTSTTTDHQTTSSTTTGQPTITSTSSSGTFSSSSSSSSNSISSGFFSSTGANKIKLNK